MMDLNKIVAMLLDKAARAPESADALRFSQAALNAAHTSPATNPLLRAMVSD